MRSKLALTLFLASMALAQDRDQADVHISAAQGTVNVTQDNGPWALSAGDSVAPQRVVTTGPDGYARFDLGGRGAFEVYGNSRVVFRRNAATPGDLLDVQSGRVRVELHPGLGEMQQRVFCRIAVITARARATVALATDEDGNVRLDVLEGEVAVQHALHPRNEPTIVKAIDSIEIERDERISRRVDRGSLYRHTVKPWHDLMDLLTAGRSRPHVEEQQQLLAQSKNSENPDD